MNGTTLPPTREMYRALLERDRTYEGVFVVGVRTTGVFCRPTCPARKPHRENVDFYSSPAEALFAGFRPCKRCRPLESEGTVPGWLRPLIERVDREPHERLKEADLRAMGLDPGRVRRWFRRHYGMTFHAYQRAHRLGLALGQIQDGGDVTRTAFQHGFESLSGFREAFKKQFGDTPGRSRSTTQVRLTRFSTPLGPIVAGATRAGVCLLEFADRPMLETQLKRLIRLLDCKISPGDDPNLDQLEAELEAYFECRSSRFTVPLVLPGSGLQRAVWDQLADIPTGETRTYGEIATGVGRAGAVRAVGRAIGDNRIAIVVPCHRVIGSNGRLRGYGGGVWRKQLLLEHERGVPIDRSSIRSFGAAITG